MASVQAPLKPALFHEVLLPTREGTVAAGASADIIAIQKDVSFDLIESLEDSALPVISGHPSHFGIEGRPLGDPMFL